MSDHMLTEPHLTILYAVWWGGFVRLHGSLYEGHNRRI